MRNTAVAVVLFLIFFNFFEVFVTVMKFKSTLLGVNNADVCMWSAAMIVCRY